MATYTLWLFLVLDTGQFSVMKSLTFTKERSCEHAAMRIVKSEPTGVKRIAAICKKKEVV
jgi:hypothetical protein